MEDPNYPLMDRTIAAGSLLASYVDVSLLLASLRMCICVDARARAPSRVCVCGGGGVVNAGVDWIEVCAEVTVL